MSHFSRNVKARGDSPRRRSEIIEYMYTLTPDLSPGECNTLTLLMLGVLPKDNFPTYLVLASMAAKLQVLTFGSPSLAALFGSDAYMTSKLGWREEG